MTILFDIAAVIAVLATALAVTRAHPVHALLYLVVSLLAAAGVMLALNAPFAAALEVMVYAGAIMVLFVFVVMLLAIPANDPREREWLSFKYWTGPGVLAAALLAALLLALAGGETPTAGREVPIKVVSIALYGPYLLAVELGSMLLLAGLVAAYHLGRKDTPRALQGRDLARAQQHAAQPPREGAKS